MSVQTAVVLAAGEGTRLRPLTRNRPKPMLPAANSPILEHVLDALVEAGIERLVLVVGYQHKRVQEHFGPSYRGRPITYVHQEKQLGTGHALLQARHAVDGSVLVANGDHLIEANSVEAVIDLFEAETPSAAMAVIERDDAEKYGAVRLDGSTIETLVEKPDSDGFRLINAGIYAFDETIFEAIEETPRQAGELALTETLARIVADGRARGVRVDGLWVDATYPWDLLEVASSVLEAGRVEEPERETGAWVAETARVHDDATLMPPVVIGADCEVGPGAVIGPTVALGENSTVEANATIERGVIETDNRVGHGATIVDAVFGQRVRVGADVTIPGGPGTVRVGNEVFERQRLGAVLADGVTVGGAATFEPGALVGPDAEIGASTHVRGQISEGAEVVR
ncbi:bifunctional sugar-1-phosphate nucleotidylyltransferase/acetyltransferase [Halovenus marina]|uniref:bifunctional sugar-1-phosphate nucleotidylyltransferase/acetyltransferase n=1 Tax=Halovenus marina TaxID=3396621 RepID=UPI003F56A6A8